MSVIERKDVIPIKDYVIRVLSSDGTVRGVAAYTAHLVSELQKRHHTWPVASAALGRTATVAAMMGAMLKEEEHRVTIRVQGAGPLGQIVVQADGRGSVRGYVGNPSVDLPLNEKGKLDVAQAVGAGMLHVIKDVGLREPQRGSIQLISGELGEDFTAYFTESEQIPSAVGVGVLVDRDASILTAGGFIIQVLPDAREETITQLEERIAAISSVTDRFQGGITPEGLLQEIMGEIRILQQTPLRFQCTCSRSRLGAILRSMGKEELKSLIEQGEAEAICHFCNEKYLFNREELEKMLQELEQEGKE
mgnify:CR=1 FL=1